MESKSIRKNSNETSNSNSSESNINHQQKNLWNVMRRIAKEEDAYKVRLLSLHRHCSKARSASIRNVVSLPSSSLTAVEAFVLGAISKMVATVATYPLQLAQVLLRCKVKVF
eukprot:scaffold7683_cov145-Skeletonema_marinoi.AAC.2